MFVTVLCCIFWGLVLNLSHSIIHPVQEWPWLWRKVLWRCQSPYHCHRWQTCLCAGWTVVHPRVSPFLLPTYHQISTLERPLVVNVPFWEVSWAGAPSQVSPFLVAAHSTSSEVFDFHIWFFPGLSAVDASTLGSLTLHSETKFIIGFDFAVTLYSPTSSCVLFDITSEQLIELTWLMLNKHKRWFHSSRVKFPLVSVCKLVFGVNVFDLDFGVQIDSIE